MPKYSLSVIPTRIFEPPFGRYEKEIRHFADIPRLRALSGRESPFAPYIFIRDNGTAQGTGENESCVVRAGEKTSKIIETMEQVQGASKGAQGVILNPFAGQLLKQDDDAKLFAPIFGWVAYTQEATARGNAVIEWVLGHPKGAVYGDPQYVAFCPANMRQELRAVGQSPTKNTYALLVRNQGGQTALNIEKVPNTIFYESGHLPYLVQEAFQSLFPAILRTGGEPLYFEGATLFLNGTWRHIILQIAHVKEKLAGLATSDMEYMEDLARGTIQHPDVADEVSGTAAMLARRLADARDDPRVIGAGFDVVGKGEREFSTLYYQPAKLRDLYGLHDPNAMLVYDDQHDHITFVTERLKHDKFFFGGIWSSNNMMTHTFRGHAHGYFSEKGILGFCRAAEKRTNAVNEEKMEKRFHNMLPPNLRGHSNLKITGRFRMEVDQTLPFGKAKVLEISHVERIQKLEDCVDRKTLGLLLD